MVDDLLAVGVVDGDRSVVLPPLKVGNDVGGVVRAEFHDAQENVSLESWPSPHISVAEGLFIKDDTATNFQEGNEAILVGLGRTQVGKSEIFTDPPGRFSEE